MSLFVLLSLHEISSCLTHVSTSTEELVTGLSCVSWEKVDVSFHNSKLRFAAHSVIQVLDFSTMRLYTITHT